MECHSADIKSISTNKTILLVGNPNVGKSVIFSLLTGKYATVSNYPGTTVEISHGIGEIDGEDMTIIDTPGTNSLLPTSEDERITRDLLLNQGDVIVQVGDAKNLKRTLMLTLQLVELGKPMVLVLNIFDEAEKIGMKIDIEKLSTILGIKVIRTVAIKKVGIEELITAISRAKKPEIRLRFTKEVERYLSEATRYVDRFCALSFLRGDETILDYITQKYGEGVAKLIKEKLKLDPLISQYIQREIAEKARKITSLVVKRSLKSITYMELFSRMTIRISTGIPILLLVLYLTYLFVGKFGAGVLVDFIENVIFNEYLNPFLKDLIITYLPIPLLQELFVGEFGIITLALTYAIAIIFPIVTTFFIAFSIMEDSGYLPRLAMLLDRVFKKVGLSGKAVLPMVLGLGCDTMATITTRTLETKRERIIATTLLALGVPCSAQLGVLLAILVPIGPKALFSVFGFVFLQMVIVGVLASKILPGDRPDFILELPPLRIPRLKNILYKVYFRLKWYIIEVIPLFILGTLILFTLDKTGLLLKLQNVSRPLVEGLLFLPPETTNIFIMGFLRRDYGAAGLYSMASEGLLTINQIIVGAVVITLFVPCIANLLVIIKERGGKTAAAIVLFVFTYAFLAGGVLTRLLTLIP
jgi:ferrous iron transport protein B